MQSSGKRRKMSSKSSILIRGITVLLCLIFLAFFLIFQFMDKAPKFYSLGISGDPPIITFYELADHRRTNLGNVRVFELDSGAGAIKEMWSIKDASSEATKGNLSKIIYGEVHNSWSESSPARHLDMNRSHRLILVTVNGTFSIDFSGRSDWNKTSMSFSR